MKNIILKINVIITALAAVFCLTSCLKREDSNTKKVKLSEVTRSIFYAPQYLALKMGYFLDEGLEVELTSAEGSEKTMTAILSSQADIGLLGSSAVINVFSQGEEDAPILFAGLTQRDGSFLVGRSDNFDWQDLKGKEIIAGRKGGVPEMVFEYILDRHGLNSKTDVKLLNNIQFNLMSVAFSRGIGDYVALFEPTASTTSREKGFYILKSLGKESEPLAYTGYCCRKKYMDENPEIIERFTRAVFRAQIWVKSHSARELAQAVLPYFIDADIDLLTDCAKNYLESDVWPESPVITPKSLDLMQEIMIRSNELEKKVEFKKIVQNEYATKTIEDVVK